MNDALTIKTERVDDPLYLPAITRVRASLDKRGLQYVGNCKMGALETRASIQAHDDFYLCPLSPLQEIFLTIWSNRIRHDAISLLFLPFSNECWLCWSSLQPFIPTCVGILQDTRKMSEP